MTTDDTRPLSAQDEADIRHRIDRLRSRGMDAGDILDARVMATLDAERARHAALVAAVKKRHADAVAAAMEQDAAGNSYGAAIWTARYSECAALLIALASEEK